MGILSFITFQCLEPGIDILVKLNGARDLLSVSRSVCHVERFRSVRVSLRKGRRVALTFLLILIDGLVTKGVKVHVLNMGMI